jgi:predicted alpha/beta-hydrolase family hydrolase
MVLDGPRRARALLVLAHGAGAGLASEFMTTVARGLAEAGLAVCRFNFPYAERGAKAPDPASVLESSFLAALEAARQRARPERVLLGGKSMGGRIAAGVAPQAETDGLIFLGYPLHPPGKPERLRLEPLQQSAATPMLFVEGTRDPFCPLPTLRAVISDLSLTAEVAEITDGDHSFKVKRSSGRSTHEAWDEVVGVVARWVDRVLVEGAVADERRRRA